MPVYNEDSFVLLQTNSLSGPIVKHLWPLVNHFVSWPRRVWKGEGGEGVEDSKLGERTGGAIRTIL